MVKKWHGESATGMRRTARAIESRFLKPLRVGVVKSTNMNATVPRHPAFPLPLVVKPLLSAVLAAGVGSTANADPQDLTVPFVASHADRSAILAMPHDGVGLRAAHFMNVTTHRPDDLGTTATISTVGSYIV